MPPPVFVHISDLHFGELEEKSLNARTEFWKRVPPFTGVLGHSADSILDLESFFASFERRVTCLVTTGDITATGNPREFDLANQYLAGILRSPEGDRVGLEVPEWGETAIPGNHDHWSGYPLPIGIPSSAFHRYFPRYPLSGPIFALRPGLRLRMLRIDTDADSTFMERVRALGSFRTQLQTLQGMLDELADTTDEIRVLCLHHSITFKGSILEINPDSRRDLEQFVLRNRISVLLSGHIHRPVHIGTFEFESAKPPVPDVIEARCGTTTQIDPTIGRHRDLDGKVSAAWPNSLLVHRVREAGQEIWWETELYLESRAGFVRADQMRSDIAPVTVAKIWPWPPQVI